MSELRLQKDVTAYYTSFQEMANDMLKRKQNKNNKNKSNETNDINWEKHLVKKKEKILGKCVVCGEVLGFISGTNTCACKNPDCKGKKTTRKDGTVVYLPIYKTLNPKDTNFANKNF